MGYSTRRFVLCLTLCHFVLVFFSPFSIAITSLGEERANLSAFRTFVRFILVWICRFPLPLGVWEGLRFVIVALPGLFSYLFCHFGFLLVVFYCGAVALNASFFPFGVLLFKISWWFLNIDNIYFDQILECIYPTELQLKRASLPIPSALFGFESMYILWYSFHQNVW